MQFAPPMKYILTQRSQTKRAVYGKGLSTMNQKLAKHFESSRRHNWVQYHPTLLKEYNKFDTHGLIGAQTARVNTAKEEEIRKKVEPCAKNI